MVFVSSNSTPGRIGPSAVEKETSFMRALQERNFSKSFLFAPGPRLRGRPAAVDCKERAGDECGLDGCQIANHRRNFFRSTEASNGLAGAKFGANLVLVVLVVLLEVALNKRRLDRPRADRVNTQRLRILNRELACHPNDGAFRSAVSKTLPDTDETRDRSDVDDSADRTAASRCGQQQRQERTCDEVNCADIDIEKAVEVAGLRLLNR